MIEFQRYCLYGAEHQPQQTGHGYYTWSSTGTNEREAPPGTPYTEELKCSVCGLVWYVPTSQRKAA